MKIVSVLCPAAALALAFLACEAQEKRNPDSEALRANEVQWNHDFASRDLGKLVAHYADDAVLMSPGAPSCSGKTAIRAMLQGMVVDQSLELKFQTARVEVSKSGDLGYTQGTYSMSMTDPNTKQRTSDHGSYVTTYRKQDGAWKAVADIATSETPTAAQK